MTCGELLEMQGQTPKQCSLMDYYTWTHQCWLTSKDLLTSALCGHWRKSTEPTKIYGWQERIRELCAVSVTLWLYIYIYIYIYIRRHYNLIYIFIHTYTYIRKKTFGKIRLVSFSSALALYIYIYIYIYIYTIHTKL